MSRRWGHARGYHEWPCTTPIVDVVASVVAVASVVIGGYAVLFIVIALGAGKAGIAGKNALFLLAIALANGGVDAFRHWRRHHG